MATGLCRAAPTRASGAPCTCRGWSCLMLLPNGGRRRGYSLPHLHLCDPCTCGGWPCLMLLPPSGRREGHSHLCDSCTVEDDPVWCSYILEAERKVTPPPSLMWSLYLWRMTLSDDPTYWRPKGRSLPLLHFCDPCTCGGWPCLMILYTGGRREGHSPTFTYVIPVPVEDDPVRWSYPLEAEGKVTSPLSLVWSPYLWRMTLSDDPIHWRPKAKVTTPLSPVWSPYLWRMTLSDDPIHWRPKAKVSSDRQSLFWSEISYNKPPPPLCLR